MPGPRSAEISESHILSTLDKGLHVLGALSQDGASSMNLTTLSRSLGMHRTTLFRILGTLQARGYVSRDPDGDGYRLGVRVLSLASSVLADLDIRKAGLEPLTALRDESSELVFLTVLDGHEVVTIERLEGRHAVTLRAQIGARRPAACTAAGKAIVAFLPAPQADAIVEGDIHLHTPNTITDRALLRAQHAEIRRRGYASDDEEYLPGVRCVAAPVFGVERTVLGAVSLAAPTMRTPLARLGELGPRARAAAREISRQLGAPEELFDRFRDA
ncbi:MAG: IclR family transcriptional regulator [Chloroflexi bacterium]|nr:IclR family transcriptional regulator [Chloroflexota bacterium]